MSRLLQAVQRNFASSAGMLVLAAMTTAGAQAQDCDRACLKDMVTKYLNAMAAHDPSRLPLTANVRFTEDSRELRLGEGLWKTVVRMGGFRQDYIDLKRQIGTARITYQRWCHGSNMHLNATAKRSAMARRQCSSKSVPTRRGKTSQSTLPSSSVPLLPRSCSAARFTNTFRDSLSKRKNATGRAASEVFSAPWELDGSQGTGWALLRGAITVQRRIQAGSSPTLFRKIQPFYHRISCRLDGETAAGAGPPPASGPSRSESPAAAPPASPSA